MRGFPHVSFEHQPEKSLQNRRAPHEFGEPQDSMGRFPDEVALETIREARSGPRVRGGALELAALWRIRLT